MKVLITGHKGLIGGALFNSLKDTYELTGFDRGDAFPDKAFDLIIHAAANCVIRDTIKKPSLAKENIDITYRVFELARKFRSKLVAFSSGRLSHESYNPYTISKHYLEDMARGYKDCYDLDTLVIRPETVWGKSLNNERVVIKWIEAALSNKPLLFFGPLDKELPPIYIGDFNQLVLDTINQFEFHKNKVITISGQIRKAVDIANTIIALTGSKSEIEFKDSERTQPQKCEPSDYTSEVSFEESLKLFLNECPHS